jgi:protein-glutamine gamma-glutamyltransferase
MTKTPEISRSVRIGAHLLVVISGVSLLLTQKLLFSSLILLVATLLALFVARRPRNSSLWEIASFLYLFFFFADWLWLTRSLAPSLVHLFIFIIINKLYNLESNRDYYQLYLLTFLSMLAATSLSIEIEMLYMILLFVIVFVWNIMSMTLIRIWKKTDPPEPFPFSLFSIRYWGFIVGATVLMLGFALCIFYLLPRTQLGYFSAYKVGHAQHISGFSQKVQLGDIADIQENIGEVMRIRITSPIPLGGHRFYWRGAAFDSYDGKSWTTANPGTNFLFQDSSGNFYVSTETNPGVLVKQEIHLSPLDTRVVFGQDRIVRVDGNFVGISKDTNATLIGMGRPEHYDVYSQLVRFTPERLRSRRIAYSDNVLRYYAKLPQRDPEIESLAQKIAGGATTVYDRVVLVKKYLEENYRYSTTNLPRSKTSPLSTFLFERKVGHCEYFATAMAILLRYLGVPTRLVNGFLEGEYNEIGDFYIVRQSDAHSWVEVYYGNGLWMMVDPSPRDLESSADKNSWWQVINFRKMLDAISFFWDRYILIFSAQDQIDILSAIRDRYSKIHETLKIKSTNQLNPTRFVFSSWRNNRTTSLLLIGVLLVSVLLFLFYRVRQKKLLVLQSPILFYRQMLMLLQKRGHIKSPATTPSEFAEEISRSIPVLANDVTYLTDLFYKARFGSYAITVQDQDFIASALARLEQTK